MWRQSNKGYDDQFRNVSPCSSCHYGHRKVRKSGCLKSHKHDWCNKCQSKSKKKPYHSYDCYLDKEISESDNYPENDNDFMPKRKCDICCHIIESAENLRKYKTKENECFSRKNSSSHHSTRMNCSTPKNSFSWPPVLKKKDENTSYLFEENMGGCPHASPKKPSYFPEKKVSNSCKICQKMHKKPASRPSSPISHSYDKIRPKNHNKFDPKVEHESSDIDRNKKPSNRQKDDKKLPREQPELEKEEKEKENCRKEQEEQKPMQGLTNSYYMAIINKNINETLSNLSSFATIGKVKNTTPAINFRVISKNENKKIYNNSVTKDTSISNSEDNSYGVPNIFEKDKRSILTKASLIESYLTSERGKQFQENSKPIETKSSNSNNSAPNDLSKNLNKPSNDSYITNYTEIIEPSIFKKEATGKGSSKASNESAEKENCKCCRFCRITEEKQYNEEKEIKNTELNSTLSKQSTREILAIEPNQVDEKSINIFVINPGPYMSKGYSGTQVKCSSPSRTMNRPGFQPFQGFPCIPQSCSASKSFISPSVANDLSKIFKSRLRVNDSDSVGKMEPPRPRSNRTDHLRKARAHPKPKNCTNYNKEDKKCPQKIPFFLNDNRMYRENELAYGQYRNAKFLFDVHDKISCDYCSTYFRRNMCCENEIFD